ncbi:hypothetical protein HPULCUR_012096 [Helicostylum pulchrum]|uniref:Uncharacterized protein n=1 Tax=Helicostylum pulchrum TaxID=562976 RepID=A0ABP9YI79_9FUNG
MSTQEIHLFESINYTNEIKNFKEVFKVGKKHSNLATAHEEALSFGKENDMAFVTTNSNATRQSLLLSFKDGSTPRLQKKVEGDEDVKKYRKDTQRFNCPCFIKYGNSVSGKVVIKASQTSWTVAR